MAGDRRRQKRSRQSKSKPAEARPEAPSTQGPRPRPIALVAGGALIAGGLAWWLASTHAPLPQPSSQPAIALEDIGPASGVDFTLENATTDDKPIVDSVLGGLAAFDYNNDGLIDLYFTNGAGLPGFDKTDARYWNRLYRNQGGGRFEDVTEAAGVRGRGYSMGVAAGDYDNDGWIDLYVCGYDSNVLLRNLHNGAFEDVTEAAAAAGRYATQDRSKPWAVAAAWLDFDRDGLLDLFIVNYLRWSLENNRVCGDPGRRLSCAPDLYDGSANILLRNAGDGTFEDVSEATGIAGFVGKGMSAAVADYNDDGFPDIFVANDGMRDFLFHNLEGKAFEERGVEAGVALNEDGVPISSMGTAWEDIDNDGRPDLFVTALTNETFPLFLNQNGKVFVDATYSSGIGLLTGARSGWGNAITDLDNDGWKDLFTANSHVSENVELYRAVEYAQPNSVFRNRGAEGFEVAPLSLPAAPHRGSAVADLNNDGLPDIVVSAIGTRPEVLINRSAADAHWVQLELLGRQSNRQGIGAVVSIETAGGLVQQRTVTTAAGYASSSDARVHFGLGEDDRLESVEIRWPSGVRQQLRDVEGDRLHRVEEPQ